MDTFNFEEAISFLRAGVAVCDQDNRTYILKDGVLLCYPDVDDKPNFRRFVTNIKIDWVLNGKWHLA